MTNDSSSPTLPTASTSTPVSASAPTVGAILGSIAAVKIAAIPAVVAVPGLAPLVVPVVVGLITAGFHWLGSKFRIPALG